MTEGLFILTAFFVAYVVYVTIEDSKGKKSSSKPPAAPKKPAATKPKPKPKPKPSEKKPAVKVAKKSAAKPAEPEPELPASNELRNPKTGEVATLSSNYRFTKRWIKDALVEEGLVPKVYKNTEIDDAAAKKIKTAFDKIKKMQKYRVK